MIYENHRPSHDIVLDDMRKIHFEATQDSDRPKMFPPPGNSPIYSKYGILNTKDATLLDAHRANANESDEQVEARLIKQIEAFRDFRPAGHKLVGIKGIWRQDDRLGPQKLAERKQTLASNFQNMTVDDLTNLIKAKGEEIPEGAENDQKKLSELCTDLYAIGAQSPAAKKEKGKKSA